MKLTLLFLMVSVFQLHSKNYSEKNNVTLNLENVRAEKSVQQGIRVTGKVVDKNGIPITAVTVSEKGTKNVVSSDYDGNYSIFVKDNKAVLIFSFVGFTSQQISIGNDTKINVTLEEDNKVLEEVVVVAYGAKKKYTLVSSVSTIAPEELQNSSQRSMSNNLAGRLTGIIGVQRNGEMGFDNSDIVIRGLATFGGNTNPLVLVDGVERLLNQMDPAEIATFTVLKDASASAIYGVRGANGVIIITTKRGKVGKPVANIRYEHTTTSPTQLPKFIGAADYMQFLNTISVQDNKAPLYTQAKIDNTRAGIDPDLNADVDWLDAVTNDFGSNDRVNFTLSGGTEMLRYAIVSAYYGEKGIMASDPSLQWDASPRLNRYNLRSNTDLNFSPTTLFKVSIGGYLQGYVRSPEGVTNLLKEAFETPPYIHPTQYSSGEIPKATSRNNPWALATQRGYERVNESKIESLFAVEQNLNSILDGLKATVKFSFDRFSKSTLKREFLPNYVLPTSVRNADGTLKLDPSQAGERYLKTSQGNEYGNSATYFEANMEYSKKFGSDHQTDALFLYNQREYDDGKALTFRDQGIAGRFSYSFKRKYIAEFNFGYNGSENFAEGMRMGFFPSYSVGWIVSEEPFMKKIESTISNLKIRASYGLAGNDDIGGDRRFAYQETLADTDEYRWGVDNNFTRRGKWEGFPGVQDLTWETSAKTNLGLELGLWNFINLNFDVFKEHRTDILMVRKSIAGSAGFTNFPSANMGEVDNQGFEIALDVNKKFSKDFTLKVFGNFTYAHNTIREYDEPTSVIGTSRARTGHSVNQIFAYVDEGLFKQEDFDPTTGQLVAGLPRQNLTAVLKPGDIKYKDLNGDGFISELDQTAIGGTYLPEIVYGAGLDLKYKNFDFSMFFQGNAKTHKVLGVGTGYFLPGSGLGAMGNIYTNYNDRWTPENPSQDVFWPRLSVGPNNNNSVASTWWIRDMSMVRLKDIEMGYIIPDSATKQIGINMLRVYIRGNNLLTFSKFKLWDPEIDTNTGFRYPEMKSFAIGLDLKF